MTVLDVGCGLRFHGDVNCDRFIDDVELHRGKNFRTFHLSSKIPNFVCCDASYLPFKNDAFSLVVSNHVIEHVANPFLMLSELIRVSSYHVKVTCPHRYADGLWYVWNKSGYHWTRKHHLSHFDCGWFNYVAKILKVKCVTSFSNFFYFPTKLICLVSIPIEITVKITKKKVCENVNAF